ncbi:MAG: glycosyltransferase family 2 protein [archaeon]
MKFSLVLCTINRKNKVKKFLESLKKQNYNNFELIVVDQNSDNRLKLLLNKYSCFFNIKHIKAKKGLSKARNVGLAQVKGDIIAFPDDDCEYPSELLFKINELFKKNESFDGITGRAVDFEGNTSSGNFDNKKGLINKFNSWQRAISFTIFIKKEVANVVGEFDESLGVGSGTIWQSAEETDYIIRCVEKGFKIYYNPTIKVFHPSKSNSFNKKLYLRSYKYGCGMGKVLKKHKFPHWILLYYLLRSTGGLMKSLLTLNFKKAYNYFYIIRGRIRGWRDSVNDV